MTQKPFHVSIKDLRPEDELLLCCARSCMDSERADRIAILISEGIDWKRLIRMALKHSVMPLIYRHLNATCRDNVPQPAFEFLEDHFHANDLKNLLLTEELLKILRLLETHGIQAIPYKGPILAAVSYGDLALRQFSDLDILVRKADASRARDLILSQGYKWLYNRQDSSQVKDRILSQDGRRSYRLPAARKAGFHRFRKIYELERTDGQVLVQLHWSITSVTFHFPLNPACLWDHLRKVDLLDEKIQTLSCEDLMLILCVHGAKHHWARLGWICDVAGLIQRRQDIDWDKLLERASKVGSRRMLLLGLLLTHGLQDNVLPGAVWERIHADRVVTSLADHVLSRLLVENDFSAVQFPDFYLKLRERFRDKLRSSFYLLYHWMPLSVRDGLRLIFRAGNFSFNKLSRLIGAGVK